MTEEKALEWVENTFSEWTKPEDRQESIYYLIKKIYKDFDKGNTKIPNPMTYAIKIDKE